MEEAGLYMLLFIAKMFGGDDKAIELIENNNYLKEEDKKKMIEFLKRDML